MYHQTGLFKGAISDTELALADILLAAVSLPVLLAIGNQSYILGLVFIELGKHVALIQHPHFHL